MTSTESPHDITLGQFTIVFVIAGLLLAWVLLQPELDGDLELGRTRLTMLASVLLLMPALVLYLFRSSGQPVANLSHLFWTAALVVFLVHTYWGAFIFYDGIADTFLNQGTPLASANFMLLTLWVADTALLWFAPEHRYGTLFHKIVRVVVFALIGLDLIAGRTGGAHILGFVFVAVVLLAAVARFAARRVQVTA
jgi:hypothetical protein